MTLIELLKQIRSIESRMLTTEGIPLKMYGKNCQVKLELYGDNGNYWVEVRTTLDCDEKVAIIMQMFEDGNNDSIAMAVANQIKQRTIDKACEWLEEEAIHGWIESEEVDKFIGLFRKSMEE